MVVRDSGMPPENYWESLFDMPAILEHFRPGRFRDVLEFGCGYGTFSVPFAEAIQGTLYTYDIDPAMVRRTAERGRSLKMECQVRDVVATGFDRMADAVLLFNILHCEDPVGLLRSAAVALRPKGEVLVIHWRSDLPTPRGPALDIRPRPEQIVLWAAAAELVAGEATTLPPWHFGMSIARA